MVRTLRSDMVGYIDLKGRGRSSRRKGEGALKFETEDGDSQLLEKIAGMFFQKLYARCFSRADSVRDLSLSS